MRSKRWFWTAMMLLIAAPAAAAPPPPSGMNVELWTDRGNDAVYQPGDPMVVKVRAAEDAYLLVYEIDSEGYVRSLYPDRGSRGFVEGRQTLQVPSPHSNLELVVEQTTGQGYLVAVVSRQPFRDMPWYLRPYDPQAEGNGYASSSTPPTPSVSAPEDTLPIDVAPNALPEPEAPPAEGGPNEEDGVTATGQIVGDPFVAIERIRRRILADPESADQFGSAYTTYYVHEQVRYPRYLCNDCHRPGHWAWWDGFDPYYATCSVFTFRVNWGWYWGPTYWYGYVPYYYYVPRYDCGPRYRLWASHGPYSSWNGWGTWSKAMGPRIRHPKTSPPPDYRPPTSKEGGRAYETPPGYISGRQVAPGRHGGSLRPVNYDSPRSRGGDGVGGIAFRSATGRVERPRDVAGGRMATPPGDWGRRRSGDNDQEPSAGVRGNWSRSGEGGMRWVGRGRSEPESRPGDAGPSYPRSRIEFPHSPPRSDEGRSAPARQSVGYGRRSESSEAPRYEPPANTARPATPGQGRFSRGDSGGGGGRGGRANR